MNDPISCIAFIIIVLSKIKAVCLSVYGREIPKGKNGWETTENQQRTMLKRLAEMVLKIGRILSKNGTPEIFAENGRFPAKTGGLELNL